MGYKERALKAEAALASLKEEDKAKAEESKAEYAEIKANYEAEIQKAGLPNRRRGLGGDDVAPAADAGERAVHDLPALGHVLVDVEQTGHAFVPQRRDVLGLKDPAPAKKPATV